MIGTIAVVAAAVLWAAGATTASRLFDRGLTPVELTGARAWLAALGLCAVVAVQRKRKHDPQRETAIPARIGVPFGLAIASANFFYYFAVSRLPVAIAIVIQYMAPGLVVAWGALVERKRVARAVVVALGLALLGVSFLAGLPALLTTGQLNADAIGLAAAGASALGFAGYILIGERIARVASPARSLRYAFTVSGMVWTVALLARAEPLLSVRATLLPVVLFIALGATLAPFLLFLWGMQHIGAARAGVISTLEPLAAAIIAFAWLGQELSGWQLAGGLLVMVGIAIVQWESARTDEPVRPPEAPPPAPHEQRSGRDPAATHDQRA